MCLGQEDFHKENVTDDDDDVTATAATTGENQEAAVTEDTVDQKRINDSFSAGKKSESLHMENERDRFCTNSRLVNLFSRVLHGYTPCFVGPSVCRSVGPSVCWSVRPSHFTFLVYRCVHTSL